MPAAMWMVASTLACRNVNCACRKHVSLRLYTMDCIRSWDVVLTKLAAARPPLAAVVAASCVCGACEPLAACLLLMLQVKIADFGLAKQSADAMSTVCGTPQYVAPEVIQGTSGTVYGPAVSSCRGWWWRQSPGYLTYVHTSHSAALSACAMQGSRRDRCLQMRAGLSHAAQWNAESC